VPDPADDDARAGRQPLEGQGLHPLDPQRQRQEVRHVTCCHRRHHHHHHPPPREMMIISVSIIILIFLLLEGQGLHPLGPQRQRQEVRDVTCCHRLVLFVPPASPCLRSSSSSSSSSSSPSQLRSPPLQGQGCGWGPPPPARGDNARGADQGDQQQHISTPIPTTITKSSSTSS
jgi:hypothetical protein